MASEYWVVEDKHDHDRGVLHRNEADAEWYRKIYDRDNSDRAPHRVVPLVEDGTPDPEVAAVVRAAVRHGSDTGVESIALSEALGALTKSQLRACGVEVDDE